MVQWREKIFNDKITKENILNNLYLELNTIEKDGSIQEYTIQMQVKEVSDLLIRIIKSSVCYIDTFYIQKVLCR